MMNERFVGGIDLRKTYPKARNARGQALQTLLRFEGGINRNHILVFDSQILSKVYPDIFPTPKDVDEFFMSVLGLNLPEVKVKKTNTDIEGRRTLIETLEKWLKENAESKEINSIVVIVPRRATLEIMATMSNYKAMSERYAQS